MVSTQKPQQRISQNLEETYERIFIECITQKKCLPCYLYEQWKDKKQSENLTDNKGKQKETNEEKKIPKLIAQQEISPK